MKVKLKVNIKRTLIAILILAMIGLGFLIYKTSTKEETTTKETVLYQYSHVPSAEYKVYIKENVVYPGDSLGEGMNYTKGLMKYIEVTLGQQFRGSEVAALSGEYEVFAEVRGYQMSKEAKSINWSKKYPIIEPTTFVEEGAEWAKSEVLKITLQDYEAFAAEAIAVTQIKSAVEVEVMIKGNINVSTPYGEVSQPIASSVIIPLQSELFTIQKNVPAPVEDAIKETEEIVVATDKRPIIAYGIGIALAVGGVLFLVFFTRPPTKGELLYSRVDKIIKDHGSRMAILQNLPDLPVGVVYEMDSIKDLMKVSDEVQKPVLYKRSAREIVEGQSFYVIEGTNLYRYIVK